MKVYCINLDRRPDRLERIMEHSRDRGIAIERVQAVDGHAPEIAAFVAEFPPGFTGLKLGPFNHACNESHRRAMQRLLDSGDSHAVVLEDDVLLASDFAKLLDPAWVPADADIVRLETFGTRVHLGRPAARGVGNRSLHHMRSRQPGTGAYVISRRGAERILPASERCNVPWDEFMFNEISPVFAQLAIYQMTPAPAIQGTSLGAADSAIWMASSLLSERLAQTQRPQGAGDLDRHSKESMPARVRRRLTEEFRALRLGTRYVKVPFTG